MPDEEAGQKLLLSAVNYLDWPKRSRDNTTTNAYRGQLNNFAGAGWLTSPLFVAWDDWNLFTDGWDGGAPFYFKDEKSAFIYFCIYSLIVVARDKKLISHSDRGMSFFVYRWLPYKSTLQLIKGSDNKVTLVESESGKAIVISLKTDKKPKMEEALEARVLDCLRPSIVDNFVPRQTFTEALNRTLTQFRDPINSYFETHFSNSVDLAQITSELVALYPQVPTEKKSDFENAARSSMFATWMFFSLCYDELTHAYYIPAHGFRDPHSGKPGIEESSGGLYVWCSKDTVCQPDWLKLHETYRGLRTSVHDWAKREREHALNKARVAARAAIMSRNFSHNVGSHSIANPRIYTSLALEKSGNAKQRLSVFHSYAQGRLDFMARAMTGLNDHPEPLFFIGDVLNGFFRQGVLLDTLVEDNGVPGEKLLFKVIICKDKDTKSEATYTWEPKTTEGNSNQATLNDGQLRHGFFTRDSINDVLIGVPGGHSGCHALYAFIENCLRNAVKYGKGRGQDEVVEFTLRLEKCKAWRPAASEVADPIEKAEEAWVLRVSDNISGDLLEENPQTKQSYYGVASKIRGFVNKPLTDEGVQGHGIQEMKVCAEALSGGEKGLRFFADKEFDEAIQAHGATGCCSTCAEYVGYRKFRSEEVQARQALRVYSHADPEKSPSLIYNLLVPFPVLLGYVSLLTSKPLAKLPEFVKNYDDLEALAGTGAHFGIILDGESRSSEYIQEVLRQIAYLHPALPFRLMVLTRNADAWETALREKTPVPGSAVALETQIPPRRLRIIDATNDDPLGAKLLYEKLTRGDIDDNTQYLGAKNWEAVALHVYDIWLRKYKPLPKGKQSWILAIGFDHGGSAVKDKWKERLDAFSSETSPPCVSVCVNVYDSPSPVHTQNYPFSCQTDLMKEISKEVSEPKLSEKYFLLLDNHGKAFPGIADVGRCGRNETGPQKSARYYQEFGLKTSLSLFQTLESPPESPFGFAWQIYSLAEGALTKVAFLDERVAQASLGTMRDFLKDEFVFQYPSYHKAGLYPLLTFRREKSECYYVSKSVQDYIVATSKNLQGNSKATFDRLWKDGNGCLEGLSLYISGATMSVGNMDKNQYEPLQLDDLDVLVVHEGVTDTLPEWKAATDLEAVYGIVPWLVRTSGRGREARSMLNWVPFIEFTDISENIYRAINKYALCKSLLGISGGVIAKGA